MTSGLSHTRKTLGRVEHLVLDFLWSQGPASAEQVRHALAKRHSMKESTARTVLRRLEDKGFLKHHVDGRTYIYSVTEQPENVAARAVRQLVDRFCRGSVEQLLVGMVNNEIIDERELERLARRIARRRDKGGEG
jgi:predicted transcriptional regulator